MRKIYWDSSALVGACQDDSLSAKFWAEGGVVRTHVFSEVFSTLTGGRLGYRVDATDAVEILSKMARHLFVEDLSTEQVLNVLTEARQRGVRGGQIHDLLHATAAVESKCDVVATFNIADFRGLYKELEVVSPEDL
jgi:predicted nucleic acid-binding protein